MNCQLFIDVVGDLVRNGELDEPMRSHALLHAQSCTRCADRLAAERQLSALLRHQDGSEAPAHIETTLVAAYRSHFGAAPKAPQRTVPAAFWAIAAGVVLMVTGAVVFRLIPSRQPGETVQSRPAPAVPRMGVPEPPAVRLPEVAAQPTPARKAFPKQVARLAPPETAEVATDFIPLASNAEILALESGQLVRVLLPRTAMASYGLPFNQERADVPVSAQVLIGQDGVARAIRFLGDSKTNIVQAGLHSKR